MHCHRDLPSLHACSSWIGSTTTHRKNMRRLRTAITFRFLVFCVFARSTRSAPFLWKGHTRYLARTVQETPGRQLYDIKIKSGTEKYDVQTIAGIHGMTVKSGATVEFSTQGDSDGVYDLEAWNVTVKPNMLPCSLRVSIFHSLCCVHDNQSEVRCCSRFPN